MNHRRRRHSSSSSLIRVEHETDRWANSLHAHVSDESLLQYVGLGSSSHTLFCRLISRSDAICGPIKCRRSGSSSSSSISISGTDQQHGKDQRSSHHHEEEEELSLVQLVQSILFHVSIFLQNVSSEQASVLGIEDLQHYRNFVQRMLVNTTVRDYLQLGSIWLLPRPKEYYSINVEEKEGTSTADTANFTRGVPHKKKLKRGRGPQRLSLKEADSVLDWDKYLIRFHFLPKRFPAAFSFDWSRNVPSHLVQVKIGEEALDRCSNEGDRSGGYKDGAIVYEVSECVSE